LRSNDKNGLFMAAEPIPPPSFFLAILQSQLTDDLRLQKIDRLVAIASEHPTAPPFWIALLITAQPSWSTAMICRFPLA
jgi:hypothetical protein